MSISSIYLYLFDEVSVSWSQCAVKCPFQDGYLPQELLLLFSYLSVSRFSSEGLDFS